MPRHTRNVRGLPIAIALPVLAVLAYSSASAIERQQTTISVDDPRPLASAIETLERRYGWAISYEDPAYLYLGDMKDVSREVRKAQVEGKPKVFVPRGGVFNVQYATVSDATLDPIVVLRRVLSDYHGAGFPGRFRILRDGEMLHVAPVGAKDRLGVTQSARSILDSRISIASQDRSALTMVSEIAKAVARISGSEVNVGMVPANLLNSAKVAGGVDQEEARSVLARTLASTGVKLSWQLFYNPGETVGAYFLNIHVVSQRAE